jgi:phage terminase large subunit-like protein
MPERHCDQCPRSGRHICRPRAARVVRAFSELLLHTKGRWARTPFELADWQREDIVVPLFGTVEWSAEWRRWVRSYRTAWIEMARKNGKSELLAGCGLVLLCCDGEEGAEVYGCARDVAQAGKVFEVAERMVQLSPLLSEHCRIFRRGRRIVYLPTASYYEAVPADAPGNLGHNPHGVLFDEVLSQPNRELWDAFMTAMGAREQPLMLAATTAGDDDVGLCATEHDYTERVIRNPSLDPRRFGYIRTTPYEADWTDPATWANANPALGQFKAATEVEDMARQAQANPTVLKAFRQFHLNTWGTGGATRWVPLEVWDATAGLVSRAALGGRRCYGGLDLASTTDLAAWCLTFPEDDGSYQALWRFYAPESRRADLNDRTGSQAEVWARDGFLRYTEGNVIDYRAIEADIDTDARDFDIAEVGYDAWGMTQLSQDLLDQGLQVVPMSQGFAAMSPPTKAWEVLIRQGAYRHGGNPVMRWMFDNIRMRSDTNDNIKIDKGRSSDKVDGCIAAVMALDRAIRHDPTPAREYKTVGFA